jgi:hypothetical protein
MLLAHQGTMAEGTLSKVTEILASAEVVLGLIPTTTLLSKVAEYFRESELKAGAYDTGWAIV